MKLTKSKLKQIIKEEMEEILRVRNPGLEEKTQEIRDQLGDEVFLKELINLISDESLGKMIQKIAKDKQLTIGGVLHL